MNRFFLASLTPLLSLLIFNTETEASDFFKSLEVEAEQTSDNEDKKSSIDVRGNVQQILKYGTESPSPDYGYERNKTGFSQVKTQLFTELSGDISPIADIEIGWQLSAELESEFYQWQNNKAEFNSHNTELFLKDAYIDAVNSQGLWLRLGHQTIAWGEAEGMSITNIISPSDQREPGQAQLRDIREPVPALFVSIPLAHNIKLNPVVTYKAKSNRYADKGDAFDFFAPFRHQDLSVSEVQPESDWEYALRLETQFNGGDFYLMAGEVNNNDFSLQDVQLNEARIRLMQTRNTIFGATLNKSFGNFLLKTELAQWQGVAIPSSDLSPWDTSKQWRAMGALEYSGVDDWLVAIELNAQINDKLPENSTQEKEQLGGVLRARYSALNERLTNQWWYIDLAAEDVRIARWDAAYEYSDNWDFALTLVLYFANNEQSLFYPFKNHDSLNASVTYSF